MITFKQQFDKLTEAYIKGEVNALDSCACFVGNLLNKNGDWEDGRSIDVIRNNRPLNECFEWSQYYGEFGVDLINQVIEKEAEGYYTPVEILSLERLFVQTWNRELYHITFDKEDAEDALFIAFEKTLDLLKQIHESKGEKVDEYVFQKRELV